MPGTIRLHRVIATKPEKIYRAFLEPDAVASWVPPYGFLCTVHELDGKVGGKHRMSFRNFTTGHSHSFGGTYQELVPGKRLVYTDKFDDANLPADDRMNRTEFIITTAIILFVAFMLGWFASWLLHRLTRVTQSEMSELDQMAQSLHEAEETRDEAIAWVRGREAELTNQLSQTEAELRAAMDGLPPDAPSLRRSQRPIHR
jgi:uncharacterized protein YndB with AHSA1/START domain